MSDLTAVSNATGTSVVLTADVAGKPIGMITVGKTSASGTVSISHTSTGTGPNDWGNTANWLSGSVPISNDDVTIDVPVPILYGLNQSGVTLTSLTITQRFTSQLGNPVMNPAGYYEYRPTELAIGATTFTNYSSSPLMKINFGTVQTAATVYSTGTSSETPRSACQLRGTHASNTLNMLSTSSSPGTNDVGWGSNGETATVATITQRGGTLNVGLHVTLTTLDQLLGSAWVYCAATTITTYGTCYLIAGAITTLNVNGGTTYDSSVGTVTTLNLNNGATYNLDQAVLSKTVTTPNLNVGTVVNTYGRVSSIIKGRMVITAL
jgi:hypothetical protein